MIFDTHAHYDDEAFDGDRPELLGRLKEAGVGAVMNVAASLESCRSTLKLAEAYDWIYGAMGVHPSETGELDQEGLQWIKEQCGRRKIKAVGEIGLDYYWVKEAEERALKTDKKRASYYNFYSNKKWGAVESYHLSVDSGAINLDNTARLILDFAQMKDPV